MYFYFWLYVNKVICVGDICSRPTIYPTIHLCHCKWLLSVALNSWHAHHSKFYLTDFCFICFKRYNAFYEAKQHIILPLASKYDIDFLIKIAKPSEVYITWIPCNAQKFFFNIILKTIFKTTPVTLFHGRNLRVFLSAHGIYSPCVLCVKCTLRFSSGSHFLCGFNCLFKRFAD